MVIPIVPLMLTTITSYIQIDLAVLSEILRRFQLSAREVRCEDYCPEGGYLLQG